MNVQKINVATSAIQKASYNKRISFGEEERIGGYDEKPRIEYNKVVQQTLEMHEYNKQKLINKVFPFINPKPRLEIRNCLGSEIVKEVCLTEERHMPVGFLPEFYEEIDGRYEKFINRLKKDEFKRGISDLEQINTNLKFHNAKFLGKLAKGEFNKFIIKWS